MSDHRRSKAENLPLFELLPMPGLIERVETSEDVIHWGVDEVLGLGEESEEGDGSFSRDGVGVGSEGRGGGSKAG